MGTPELNDYENLGMTLHSIEMFWNDLVKMTGEGDNDFDKNWRLVSDEIPCQFYRTTTIPEMGRA